MRTKVQKWGNSLGLRIPRAYAAEVELRSGSEVDVTVRGEAIVVTPVRSRPATLDDLVAKIKPSNRHAEVDFGRPMGREVW